MRYSGILPALLLAVAASQGFGWAQSSDRIQKSEIPADPAEARSTLGREAANRPNDIAALTGYAEFLDRYGDPESRDAYRKLLAALRSAGQPARAAGIARRLVRLDLLAGDRESAARDLQAYSAAAGKPLTVGDAKRVPDNWATITVPGPMRSFARMAAISPDSNPEDILPALGRNIVTNGYQASSNNEALEATEYLKLLRRYLSQARELQAMAGDRNAIRIQRCEAPEVADLLRILGYRMRGGCGSEVVLETVNAGRAFLTIDSGFPINKLEQALRTDRPFEYDFRPTSVPVLFGPAYWTGGKSSPDFIDAFVADPSICRLYVSLAKLDPETAGSLRKAIPLARLKAYAHVLDFYGGMFEIRGGKAVAPGGARTAATWADLAGASPDQGAPFFEKLIAKDDGWLASMYDALSRIQGPVYDYLTEPARLKRFYGAVRGRVTSPGPARPVFRANADMMLLTTRLRLDPDGKAHIPGSLDTWKTLFINHPAGKYDTRLSRMAPAWKEPDDVIEALFALCRKNAENQPLKIFMAVSDLERSRGKPLQPATVDRLARAYRVYGSQYAAFAESGALSDKSIVGFLDSAESISKIHDQLLRLDASGAFQSLIGLWQILVRQQNIPESRADSPFAAIVSDFGQIRSSADLFDAGRKSVTALLAAARLPESGATATQVQESLVDLLAGGAESRDADAHQQIAAEMLRILDAQRIVSLDSLFQIADRLDAIARGEKADPALIKLANRIAEIQLPRMALSTAERNSLEVGYWTERHIEAQRNLRLRSAVEKAGTDPEKIKEVRGMLAPLLRDTLVAFNYAYYAPPGAQVLNANPLFVRSHDFFGVVGGNAGTWYPAEVAATGWPSNAGGKLVGSLAGLPWALAEAEQNFLVPSQTQALIWGDLVPQMIVSATLPRWWTVTPLQMHWVGLHLRYGGELLAESALDPETRAQALESLRTLATPARVRDVSRLLAEGDVKTAADRVTPSELFALARALAPGRNDDSCVLAELRDLSRSAPRQANYPAISGAFGTPKPTLANSYRPELLNLRTFPTLMGYSSRVMAESWESNTLYWAALADELYLSPAELNIRIPEWTRQLVERIFASNLDDWPAVLKSLRVVGEDERARNRPAAAGQKAALELLPNR